MQPLCFLTRHIHLWSCVEHVSVSSAQRVIFENKTLLSIGYCSILVCYQIRPAQGEGCFGVIHHAGKRV